MENIRIHNLHCLVKKVFKKLIERKLTISFAESITGGMLSSVLVMNAGASEVFVGSRIVYQTNEKVNQLGVSNEMINEYGVVSNEVAIEMAKCLKNKTNVDVAVSITGSAGPKTINENKKEAFFTILYNDNIHTHHILLKSKSRKRNLKRCVKEVYLEIYNLIK